MIGKKFGSVTVLGYVCIDKGRNKTYNCICDCGEVSIIRGEALRSGNNTSCGCGINKIKHGKFGTPIYNVWGGMLARCYRKSHTFYHRYGGRGITVCLDWHQFVNFYQDMGDRPSELHKLDRKDNDKGYCKENCRWATQKEQMNNTSRNVHLTLDEVTKTLAQWSNAIGISQAAINYRIKAGWSVDKILSPEKHNKTVGFEQIISLESRDKQ